MTSSDPYDLGRFLAAQEDCFNTVLGELRKGRKSSHWMWFVFPQIHGLGSSATTLFYSIKSLEEARAYLSHEELGPRLEECVKLVLRHSSSDIESIFSYPDYMKFHSCMTLFTLAAGADSIFNSVLEAFFSGELDSKTEQIVAQQ